MAILGRVVNPTLCFCTGRHYNYVLFSLSLDITGITFGGLSP